MVRIVERRGGLCYLYYDASRAESNPFSTVGVHRYRFSVIRRHLCVSFRTFCINIGTFCIKIRTFSAEYWLHYLALIHVFRALIRNSFPHRALPTDDPFEGPVHIKAIEASIRDKSKTACLRQGGKMMFKLS